MAVVEVSITPLGTADPGVSRYVAGCLKIVRQSGINYQLTRALSLRAESGATSAFGLYYRRSYD